MRRPGGGDLSGSVADLGIFVPLVAALILVNGMQPGPLLLIAGLGSWRTTDPFGEVGAPASRPPRPSEPHASPPSR